MPILDRATTMDPFHIALVLYALAVVLAFVDLFIPSGGILIILGVVSAVACVLFAFQSSYNFGLLALAIVLASVPCFAFAAISIWPRTPIGKRIILGTPKQTKSDEEPKSELDSLIGLVVNSDAALMPSGHLRIGSRRYNARTRSGIIEAGQTVEVVGVQARELIVQPTNKALSKLANPQSTDEKAVPPGKDNLEAQTENLLDLPVEDLGLDSLE